MLSGFDSRIVIVLNFVIVIVKETNFSEHSTHMPTIFFLIQPSGILSLMYTDFFGYCL